MAEVTLSAGIRSNLVSLQNTNALLNRTQERLSTGKAVNSAIDSPENFFAAASLNDRASQLETRLDGMGQAISTLQAADNAINGMRGVISVLKSVVEEANGQTDSTDRISSGKRYNELLLQLYTMAEDSGYQGVNLLKSNESNVTEGGTEQLTVQFNESFDVSVLNVNGVNVMAGDPFQLDPSGEITTSSAMSGPGGEGFAVSFNFFDQGSLQAIGLRSAELSTTTETAALSASGTSSAIAWADDQTYRDNLDLINDQIQNFDQALVNTAKAISQNVNIVSLRQDFTTDLVNILKEGSDKLTLADLNEEGANLLALQTAQQLGSQSLAIASQANQAVLTLLG